MARKWTAKELNYINQNYSRLSNLEIAKMLERTLKSIELKGKRLGLRKKFSPPYYRKPSKFTFSTCTNCGRKFRVFPRTLKRGGGKFCSRKCLRQHKSINKQKAGLLFAEWVKGRLPLRLFIPKTHRSASNIIKAFKEFFPAEYEFEIEKRMCAGLSYKKGRRFEYRTRNYLREKGFLFSDQHEVLDLLI